MVHESDLAHLGLEPDMSPKMIDRFISRNDARPVQHSIYATHKELQDPTNLLMYIHNPLNTNYQEQILDEESRHVYDEFLPQ